MDRLTAYRSFCSIVRNGTFTAAARELGLSNAAVSKNIKELETELGVRLLTRTTRLTCPTEVGALYYERVSNVLRDMTAADNAVVELSKTPRGVVRVAIPMSLGLLQIAPIVSAFLKAHPAVTIDLVLDDSKVDLVEGQFDLAIRGHGALPNSSLISRRLSGLSRVVCGAPSYLAARGWPRKPIDLCHHACLIYTHSAKPDQWTLTRNAGRQTVQVGGPLRANNSLAIREAALAGVGLALLPRPFIEDDLSAGHLHVVLKQWRPEHQWIYAIYPSGPYMSARVRLLIDFLSKYVRNAGLSTHSAEPTHDAHSESILGPSEDPNESHDVAK